MKSRYPAFFADQFGSDQTYIENNGETLTMRVRGVRFTSEDFEDFEFAETVPVKKLEEFQIHQGSLCGFSLLCTIPMLVSFPEGDLTAQLHVNLVVGQPNDRGNINDSDLAFQLICDDLDIRTEKGHSSFEDGLNEINSRLPSGVYLRACYSCRYSDYHPVGESAFGHMACFRDNKEAYLKVKAKGELFKMWDTLSLYVQETHVCPEFAKRLPNQFYRV
ncbi:MAG: DUF6304 family protein [Planctomycetota bacterium]|nr:DUF6304 family protein [Planctomycetota bacterium]